MPMFDDKVKSQLKDILSQMSERVKVLFFSQEIECFTCRDARIFLEEVSSVNSKIILEKYSLLNDREKAESYKVTRVPAIVLLDSSGKDTGIRFYGIPGGYEINSFLQALIEVSGKREALPDIIMQRIKNIDKDIHIQVFVTLGCPYCPNAVATAHRLALENDRITADMVESNSFTDLAVKYNVSSVPKIVINDSYELVGAQPVAEFLNIIEKV